MISKEVLNIIPNSLQQLQAYFRKFYSEHEYFCINTQKSFLFEGGSEPLDYIFVFRKEHSDNLELPRHWHYIGLGLSDIYNYKQFSAYFLPCEDVLPLQEIYPPFPSTKEQLSGFGFELTFRLKCNSDEDWNNNDFPRWPCRILQALAKHVYESQNLIMSGENFDWKVPLVLTSIRENNTPDDDDEEVSSIQDLHHKDSIVKHFITTTDAQLQELDTATGKVKFLQIVGVSDDELRIAREWSGSAVLDMIRDNFETGGNYHVTDMERSIDLLQTTTEIEIQEKIKQQGCNMTIVNATHKYSSRKPNWYKDVENNVNTDKAYSDDETHHGQEEPSRCPSRQSRISFESETALKILNAELAETRYYDNIFLLLPFKSAQLLPIALKRRLAFKKNFTFKNIRGDLCVTLFPEGSTAVSMVSSSKPYVRHGVWLHVYISEELRLKMIEIIGNDFERGSQMKPPKNYSWPEHKFYITVIDEVTDHRLRSS